MLNNGINNHIKCVYEFNKNIKIKIICAILHKFHNNVGTWVKTMNYLENANHLIHVIHKFTEEVNGLTKIVEDFHKFVKITKIQPVLKNFFTIFYGNETFFHKFNIERRNVHEFVVQQRGEET